MPSTLSGESIFGRIVTRRDIELALCAFLRNWIPTYVAEIERQAGLPAQTIPLPPDPALSYRGGLDFNTWQQTWAPVFIVTVTPQGAPERKMAAGVYCQTFLIGVAVNFVVTNEVPDLALSGSEAAGLEDNARQYADMLGMAACAAILQNGQIGLWPDGGPISTKTTLLRYPTSIFPNPDNRRIVRSWFELTLVADWVLQEAGGPGTPPIQPYGDSSLWPTIEAVDVTLEADPIDA